MFTGLVQAVGTIRACTPTAAGRSLIIAPGAWDHAPSPGDSIAVNGCCLTVAECLRDGDASVLWRFDVITQTLHVTTLGALVEGGGVNLESSVTPATLLGGHLVQGHIDAIASVVSVQDEPEDWRVRLQPPADRMDLMDMIVARGSIALDGVSLTIAEADDCSFEVALIPETLERTTLRGWRPGSSVNMEVDQIARTVVTYLRRHR
ncbi:MAG: riboflavin synthase [Phycisphaerales bacterium]|nr:riboflavin synthase [Phycisphaerales bacterium]